MTRFERQDFPIGCKVEVIATEDELIKVWIGRNLSLFPGIVIGKREGQMSKSIIQWNGKQYPFESKYSWEKDFNEKFLYVLMDIPDNITPWKHYVLPVSYVRRVS